jgi:secernin
VFKPVRLGGQLLATGQPPGEGYDTHSLFWQHERLHRLVLGDYASRKALFNDARLAMQAKFAALIDHASHDSYHTCWDEHREAIPAWTTRITRAATPRKSWSFFNRYWDKQEHLDRGSIAPAQESSPQTES